MRLRGGRLDIRVVIARQGASQLRDRRLLRELGDAGRVLLGRVLGDHRGLVQPEPPGAKRLDHFGKLGGSLRDPRNRRRVRGGEADEDLQPVLDGTDPVPGPGVGREQLLGQGYQVGVDHGQPARQLVGCGHAPMPGRGVFLRGALDEGSVVRSSHKVMVHEFD